MTITVKQYGLFQSSGTLASIVDGDDGTGWAPVADGLAAYTANFLNGSGLPNSGNSFPGFEFDFGTPVRVASFVFTTETVGTLARGMLIASDNPATGVSDMVQAGDTLLGIYEQDEVNSGRVLATRARTLDIRGRYVRFVMRDPTVEDTSDPAYVDPSSAYQFDTPGPFSLIVPEYTGTWTTEAWGAGASGGVSGNAADGGNTTVQFNDSDPVLTAHGGDKSALTSPNTISSQAQGGTGGNGNTTNTDGGDGGVPSNTTTAFGTSGKGGDAPNGGAGGAAVTGDASGLGMAGGGSLLRFGLAGAAPGGGGGGRVQMVPSGDLLAYKYPGGGAGEYVKHVLTRGVDGPEPGDPIVGIIGAGGTSNTNDGAGANGRVKFSFSA